MHDRAAIGAGEDHAHRARTNQECGAECELRGRHVELVERDAVFRHIPIRRCRDVTADKPMDQAHAHCDLEAFSETGQCVRLGAGEPPFRCFGKAFGGAFVQRARHHQHLVEAGRLIAAHQRTIAQHIRADVAAHPGKLCAAFEQARIHPIGRAVIAREERLQGRGRIGDGLNAMFKRAFEKGASLPDTGRAHPGDETIHRFVAAHQGLTEVSPFGGIRLNVLAEHAAEALADPPGAFDLAAVAGGNAGFWQGLGLVEEGVEIHGMLP